MEEKKEAYLILEDGSVILGYSFGAEKDISGEVVFNTGMTGYPETLTDPSYSGQILVFTYPLIGNYGVPGNEMENGILKNFESEKIQTSGIIVSEYSFQYGHWNAKKSLGAWLKENNVPGIYGIDTRKLTKILREKGTMLGKIVFKNSSDFSLEKEKTNFFDPNKINLVEGVSVKQPVIYGNGKKKVILVDCGCKNSIIKNLLEFDITIKRVPWNYDFSKEDYDGIFITNGPGDPKMCKETISNVKKALEKNKTVFGICFGNQILALAAGGDTYKLKYGHRSQNQPCLEAGTKRCYITSQNHGFAVKKESLPKDWEEWFININDETNEGIRHKTKPFMSVQFHPEASPGPVDTKFLFKKFFELL